MAGWQARRSCRLCPATGSSPAACPAAAVKPRAAHNTPPLSSGQPLRLCPLQEEIPGVPGAQAGVEYKQFRLRRASVELNPVFATPLMMDDHVYGEGPGACLARSGRAGAWSTGKQAAAAGRECSRGGKRGRRLGGRACCTRLLSLCWQHPCAPIDRDLPCPAGYVRLVNFSGHAAHDMQRAIWQLKVRGPPSSRALRRTKAAPAAQPAFLMPHPLPPCLLPCSLRCPCPSSLFQN